MDKNLINIDDLVRQRLMGGEEREKPGAWLRMSELLEKELPQAVPMAFNWRRMFGAMAILVLIGALTLGGYELNVYRQLHTGNEEAAVSDAVPAGTATPVNKDVSNTQLSTSTPAAVSNNETPHGNNNKPHNKAIAANTNTKHKTNNSDQHKTNNTQDNNTTAQVNTPAAATPVAGNEAKPVVTKKDNAAPVKNNADVANNNTEAPALVAANKPNTDNKATDNSNKTADAGDAIPAPSKHNEPVTPRKVKENTKHDAAAKHVANAKPAHKEKETAVVNNEKPAGKHDNAVAKTPVAMKDMALGSTAPKPSVPEKKQTVIQDNESPKDKLAKRVAMANKNARVHGSVASNNKRIASNTSVKNRKSNNAGNKPGKTPAADKAGSGNEQDDVAIVNKRKGKKVIEKMVVYQRYIKNNINETTDYLDTVSIENITQEFDIFDPKALAEKNNALKAADAVATSDDPDADSSPIRPGSDKMSTDSKENKYEKKSKGALALEGLNAAFNDIKYKVGHATFQPGIVAGVNATFFGPNSFKGFQFGVSGKFVFSEALSLMGELKYFNRINNNYILHDDFYRYDQVAGGYARTKMLNPYSISTLHSIEMPVSLRYAQGNFNFFFGPNLVYTFAVNTGDYPMADPTTDPVIVSQPGNDNMPKLKTGDFNSRFGVGYLFGVSYQVSPKLMIDLRDVQTFWDNANTAGSKYVSSQLFSSPSFQLSIGYRLGGNKDKDK